MSEEKMFSFDEEMFEEDIDFEDLRHKVEEPEIQKMMQPLTLNESVDVFDADKESDNDDAHKVSIRDFEIRRVLGIGGYGKVFQVMKLTGSERGQIFAMKVLKKKTTVCNKKTREKEMVINTNVKLERDVLLKMIHPFIVEFHCAFQAGGKVYLVMEYLAGGDLYMQLQREGMMMEEQAIFYLAQVLLAIEYLHKQGIIYMDLKPENIMLDREGYVKLTDFGGVKEFYGYDNKYIQCGTLQYMAPEILDNSDQFGKEVDWWSFGIVTHELLTGSSPFTGSNNKVLEERILKCKLQLKNYLTPDANDILRKLLNREIMSRLGYGVEDAQAVKNHRFFSLVNWEDLLARKCEPPFLPHVKEEEDFSNFCAEFTSLPACDSPPGSRPSHSVENFFLGFSYNGA